MTTADKLRQKTLREFILARDDEGLTFGRYESAEVLRDALADVVDVAEFWADWARNSSVDSPVPAPKYLEAALTRLELQVQ